MKKCAYCGKENPDDATVCALDQQPLVLEAKAPAPRKFSSEEIRAHRAARPPEVTLAVGLLAFGAAFALVRFLMKYHPYLSRHIDFGFSMIFGDCLVALLLYLVFCGKNWARWVFLCLILLSVLPSASHVPQWHWDSYVYLAIDIVAIAALFQRSANEWFTKLKKVPARPLPAV